MSESNDTEDRSAGGKTLSMRRGVEQGRVKQNFSHGRSKTVVVETKRRRSITAPGAAPSPIESKVMPASTAAPQPAPAAPVEEAAPQPAANQLSDSEKKARAEALAGARLREADDAEAALTPSRWLPRRRGESRVGALKAD